MSMHMNHPLIRSVRWPLLRSALVAALLAAPVLACAHEKAPVPPPAATSMPMDHARMGQTGPMPMDHARMGQTDAHAGMSMTGDVDYDFAVNMRKHHQMAVMMSEAQLKNGKDAKLRAMATQIIAAQKKEVAQLDRWIGTRDRAKASQRAN